MLTRHENSAGEVTLIVPVQTELGQTVCRVSYRIFFAGGGDFYGSVSLVPRPHPLTERDGLVNEVEFLGLEAYYGMCNHCIILWC